MIKKLRRKFISITAFSLFGVLFFLILAINFINIYKNESDLDHILDVILENKGRFPEYRKNPPNINVQKDTLPLPQSNFNRELFFTTRFCVVTLNTSMEIVDIYSDKISALSETEIKEYTKNIISSNKTDGWMNTYKYRLCNTETGAMLIILDGSSTKQTNFSIFIISIAVALISFFIVLIIIIFASKKAIRPIIETNEKQKQFITDASHELKTPLTIISANSEILTMTYGEDEWIQGIKKQTDRMRDLINNLITLTKLDEEKQVTTFETFCLSDAIYDTAMAFDGLCKNDQKQLHLSIANNINVRGNESSIRQLLSILLDNAVKYCDTQGEIHVTLKKEKQTIILVANSFANVTNIPLDHLFDRFYRADKARTQKGSYGLGLSIAKAIVSKHHGKIKAKNVNNQFIEFEIKLP